MKYVPLQFQYQYLFWRFKMRTDNRDALVKQAQQMRLTWRGQRVSVAGSNHERAGVTVITRTGYRFYETTWERVERAIERGGFNRDDLTAEHAY